MNEKEKLLLEMFTIKLDLLNEALDKYVTSTGPAPANISRHTPTQIKLVGPSKMGSDGQLKPPHQSFYYDYAGLIRKLLKEYGVSDADAERESTRIADATMMQFMNAIIRPTIKKATTATEPDTTIDQTTTEPPEEPEEIPGKTPVKLTKELEYKIQRFISDQQRKGNKEPMESLILKYLIDNGINLRKSDFQAMKSRVYIN